jgi:hypothetical protein
MNKNTSMIRKAVAVLLILIGLVAMIVAWSLLFAGQYTNTVLAMEMGGVILCLAGYFLWQRSKRVGKDARQE